MNGAHWLAEGGTVVRAVAVVLFAMSVCSWVVIIWKAWMLHRARFHVTRSVAVFWQATSLDDAAGKIASFDPLALVAPMVHAIQKVANVHGSRQLEAAGDRGLRATRGMRTALQAAVRRLQFGQVLLATVASTSPFVGLLGTVWGIHRALASITGGGQITIDRLAGPVGEALVMTAAGLAVAIPAVLAYNVFGRSIARIEEDLEGFAHDLHALATGPEAASDVDGLALSQPGPAANAFVAG